MLCVLTPSHDNWHHHMVFNLWTQLTFNGHSFSWILLMSLAMQIFINGSFEFASDDIQVFHQVQTMCNYTIRVVEFISPSHIVCKPGSHDSFGQRTLFLRPLAHLLMLYLWDNCQGLPGPFHKYDHDFIFLFAYGVVAWISPQMRI